MSSTLKGNNRKVFVVGLDCGEPDLVFNQWKDSLPNLNYLAQNGLWGDLNSSIPAITVPAWTSMLSSRDPGSLGIYGFRNRIDHSYNNMSFATSGWVKEKRVWDYLSLAGKRSIVVGVPQTYPVAPLNGKLISGFLTPGLKYNFSYPAQLKQEVLRIVPEYQFDVAGFRTENKDWLLNQIFQMTEKRFRITNYLLMREQWDFFMVMEIGLDRLHHGFWSYHDPEHRKYKAGNPYESAIFEYYQLLDRKIGEWIDQLDKNTVVMVVSDHGAQRMDGGICLNEWLWQNDYLHFKNKQQADLLTRFEDLEVDWSRTTAWGSGGYYGRVFLNISGREPEGIIPPEQVFFVRQELSDKLKDITDDKGQQLDTNVYFPENIYQEVRNVAPDLIVYFGNLLWRSVGSLGHGSHYTFDNDIGPDDCNHKQQGMAILFDPNDTAKNVNLKGANLMDIAPTILKTMGIRPPMEMQGLPLWKRTTNISESQREIISCC